MPSPRTRSRGRIGVARARAKTPYLRVWMIAAGVGRRLVPESPPVPRGRWALGAASLNAAKDNPGEGLDRAARCLMLLALGVLQAEAGLEDCGQSDSVVSRRWQPRALGRACLLYTSPSPRDGL